MLLLYITFHHDCITYSYLLLSYPQQEDEAKRKKEEEAVGNNPAALAALKESEQVSKDHEVNKTKHYAKLGATFAIKENTLNKNKSAAGTAGRNSTTTTSSVATTITPKKINTTVTS